MPHLQPAGSSTCRSTIPSGRVCRLEPHLHPANFSNCRLSVPLYFALPSASGLLTAIVQSTPEDSARHRNQHAYSTPSRYEQQPASLPNMCGPEHSAATDDDRHAFNRKPTFPMHPHHRCTRTTHAPYAPRSPCALGITRSRRRRIGLSKASARLHSAC